MTTLVEDLKAARALIDTPHKWGKGLKHWMQSKGRACAHEACRRTSVSAGDYTGLGKRNIAMRRALQDALPDGWRGEETPAFNDHRSTTHADIMALFDRAIASAEALSQRTEEAGE